MARDFFKIGANVIWDRADNDEGDSESLPGEITSVNGEDNDGTLICTFRGGEVAEFRKSDGKHLHGLNGGIRFTHGEYLRFLKERELIEDANTGERVSVQEEITRNKSFPDVSSVNVFSLKINDIVVLHTINPIDEHTLNIIQESFDSQIGFHILLINLKPGADANVLTDEELDRIGLQRKG